MPQSSIIKGFSKLSPEEKIKVVEGLFGIPLEVGHTLRSFFHPDSGVQKVLSELSENTLTNYPLPYNVAPNFVINDRVYMVPMVTEESSVVAAASAAASFWASRGGFRARITGTQKTGQVHFLFTDDFKKLEAAFAEMMAVVQKRISSLAANMVRRGGGITGMEIRNRTHLIENYFQLHVSFETVDAMGANFINSVLEECSRAMADFFEQSPLFDADAFEPLMCILSNHVPDCLVEVKVECPVEDFDNVAPGVSGRDFARRFVLAVEIAENDIHRATTHNKGIMNGVDAVVIATGNDFRAIEAGAHAYAAKNGQYTSLSHAKVENGLFSFTLLMPLAIGTTGGLTRLHPLADLSLKMLGNPGAQELMMIAAAAGLANNFAAVRSLTTTGIQAGHMRMHLPNILAQLGASPAERDKTITHFKNQSISFQKVDEFLKSLRSQGK